MELFWISNGQKQAFLLVKTEELGIYIQIFYIVQELLPVLINDNERQSAQLKMNDKTFTR